MFEGQGRSRLGYSELSHRRELARRHGERVEGERVESNSCDSQYLISIASYLLRQLHRPTDGRSCLGAIVNDLFSQVKYTKCPIQIDQIYDCLSNLSLLICLRFPYITCIYVTGLGHKDLKWQKVSGYRSRLFSMSLIECRHQGFHTS
jgi:hypothetical protein